MANKGFVAAAIALAVLALAVMPSAALECSFEFNCEDCVKVGRDCVWCTEAVLVSGEGQATIDPFCTVGTFFGSEEWCVGDVCYRCDKYMYGQCSMEQVALMGVVFGSALFIVILLITVIVCTVMYCTRRSRNYNEI